MRRWMTALVVRTGGVSGAGGRVARRVLALAVVAGLVTAMVGASAGIASASSEPHRQLRHDAGAAPGSGLTLARAPAGLRAAVRRTLGAPAASAGSAFQKGELTASGGAEGDQFGNSVAVSGSTAIVGAPYANSYTGAAYVFTRSSTGTWSQQAELTAPVSGDDFGWSVAVSGSTAMVGAPASTFSPGAAYVYTRSSTGSWSQQAELTASGGVSGDMFGDSVALSGATAVVGAPGNTTFFVRGAAYVFTRSSTGTWSQQAGLTDPGGSANDYFGDSVAISRSTAVVGADGNNSNTGAAYVFAGPGGTWSQQAELTASGGAAGDEFGYSVAVSGSTAVVGAPYKNSSTGAAYVFAGPGGAWSQQAELTAPGGGSFGFSVAVSGSTAMVGAPTSNSGTGAVYVFAGRGGTWSQQTQLTASDGAAHNYFGYSVAFAGSTAVVGAYGKNGDTGAAYVFVLPSQQAKLTTSPSQRGAFGLSVAISGSTAVVGAPFSNSYTGAAYVFVRSHGTWSKQAELTASDGGPVDQFGRAVAISGSTAVIGAWGNNTSSGAAYVFARSGGTWSQQAELTAPDGAGGDQFGHSVAIVGSTAIVGAPYNNSSTGAAYVFALSGGTWSQQAELTASDGAAGDEFGSSVAISGSTALVGAPGKNSSTGAAYVFASPGGTWSQQAELTASDGTTYNDFGDAVAVSGSTAAVGAYGKNSVTGAVYVFASPGGTWSQQTELTASNGTTHNSFGWSVAMSGSTAVVGTPARNSDTGAAYVFANM